MRVALVSSCTNRKKLKVPDDLRARNLPEGTLEFVAREWASRVEGAPGAIKAKDLYAGRAFTEVLASRPFAEGGCYIVSAGLGVIELEEAAPAYSLTVVGRDPDNVLRKIATDCIVHPRDWWRILVHKVGVGQSLVDIVEHNEGTLFVLALPSTYLKLLEEDLLALSEEAVARTRIIGLPSLRKLLPESIQSSLITYDERFEAAGVGLGGTRSDFSQRAARHFLSFVLPGCASRSASDHRDQVSRWLRDFSRPITPKRQRYDDEDLKKIIREMWDETKGLVTIGLRMLRRERNIACEQSRFKRLFREVAEEMHNL